MAVSILIVGGFLGAGKTTAVLRLAKRAVAAGRRVAIVTNDQADNLVDTATVRANGLDVREVAGGCFCGKFDDLVSTIDRLEIESRPDTIIAEPVGSCTDLGATVINPLKQYYADRIVVSPLTVLIDPIRALKVLGGEQPVGLSARVTYIYRIQQQEADAIAVNKIDLLSAGDRDRLVRLVEQHFPGRPSFAFSAQTGERFEPWAAWMDTNAASGRIADDLDYDVYAAGEAELGWLNSHLALESDAPFAMDDVLFELADAIRTALGTLAMPIAHGKMLLSSGRDASTINVVDSDVRPCVSRCSGARASAASLTMNWRVQAPPAAVADSLEECLQRWVMGRQFRITGGAGQCFSPGRPVPRHRLNAEGRSIPTSAQPGAARSAPAARLADHQD